MIKTKQMKHATQEPPTKLILPFLFLTMILSWSIWWMIVFANKVGFLSYGTIPMIMVFSIGILSPAISAAILLVHSKIFTGKQLLKTIFHIRRPFSFYLFVAAIALITYLIPLMLNKAEIVAPLYLSFLLLPFDLIGGGLEEVGWRFFLQPALEQKFSFSISTIITALVWSVWHLPIFFIDGTNQSTWHFGVFMLLALGMSFILASIYRVTNNILACIFFHTLWNALGETIAINMDVSTILPVAVILIAISYGLLYRQKENSNHAK